jgi:hypothetical protein
MGIKSIFKKITGGVKESITGEASSEDEFGLSEFEDTPTETPTEEPSADMPELAPELRDEEPETITAEPEPEPEAEPQPEPELLESAPPDDQKVLDAIDNLKLKMDVVTAKFDSLEAKTAYQRSETERYMQQMSYLNEKLDHIQEEQMEIERLLKSKQ